MKPTLPTLRKGSVGAFVQWLQVLLNLQHPGTTPLNIDGAFGQKTYEAVLSFQKAQALSPDGVVGLDTWTRLQTVHAELPTSPKPQQTTAPASQIVGVSADTPVADWSLTRRFTAMIELSPKHMLPELAAQFRAMLTPLNMGILVGTLVAWAVSHAFGPGEVADVIAAITAVLGTLFLGMNLLQAAEGLYDCLMMTVEAKVYSDLDRASDRFAAAVAIIGVMAFFALIARLAGKFKIGEKLGQKIRGLFEKTGEPKPLPPPKTNNPEIKENPDEETPDPKAARAARIQELAKDPAHNGIVSPKSIQEAEAGLGSEENGRVPGPITRDPSPKGADFIDGEGQKWDVKRFNSNFPKRKGGFDLETDLGKIQDEVSKGENVIVDTRDLTGADTESLQGGVEAAGLSKNVVWYP